MIALTVTISGCSTCSVVPTPTPSPTATPVPTAAPTAAPSATSLPDLSQEKTWDNGNVGMISGTVKNPTEVTFSTPVTITYMNTYHWNHAQGVTPGTISLKHEDGTVYGPWQATGSDGMGGVKNAYWVVYPNVTIKAGKYTVVDSDPSTWSTNSAGNYVGFANIKYHETP